MTHIYIAGPMRNYPELNFPAFNLVADDLRSDGLDVVNPVDINPDPNTPYEECMKKDIEQLITCNAIYMLVGWEESKGATLEHEIALALGMEIWYEEDDLNNNNNNFEGERDYGTTD